MEKKGITIIIEKKGKVVVHKTQMTIDGKEHFINHLGEVTPVPVPCKKDITKSSDAKATPKAKPEMSEEESLKERIDALRNDLILLLPVD